MELIGTYTMADWMLEDAAKQYGFFWQVTGTMQNRLRTFCAMADKLLAAFRAESCNVSVDENGLLHIGFSCRCLTVGDSEREEFLTLVRESCAVHVGVDDSDAALLSVELVFCVQNWA